MQNLSIKNLGRLKEANIAFVGRIHPVATVSNLNLGLIRDFLREINSGLFEENVRTPFADLFRQSAS